MIPSRAAPYVQIGEAVRHALHAKQPIVVLETAVVTHGLPHPHNLEAAAGMAGAVEAAGAVPAICLVEGGRLCIGATLEQAERVARHPQRQKAAARDLGAALASGAPAGLTVSATLFAAGLIGAHVFATGGIGGAHVGAEETGDVSSDLVQLSRTPVITVCSGAKSVLDIPRTLEFLETAGVPVFGYRTTWFPAFYLRSSQLPVPALHSPEEVGRVAQAQWGLGYEAGIVVGNPLPAEEAIGEEEWRGWLDAARAEAQRDGVRGKDVTPYLLDHVAAYSEGRTVQTNLALLERNARLAAEIATVLRL
jgi:pseudouridine-5'-phosphate glycosidase